jgi:NAD(P)H-flavin reductase
MSCAIQAAAAVNPWTVHAVSIVEVAPEMPGVSTYRLAFRDAQFGEAYRFRPGQFNMLYVPGVGESAISISDDPTRRGPIAHTIRTVGNVSAAIERMGRGGELGLRGPFGSSWPIDQARGRHVLVIAGGLGLAPLRPAICELLARRGEFSRISLLYGSRSPELLLYQRELEDWRRQEIDVQLTVDRGSSDWQGNVGVVTQLVERLELDAAQTTAFVCGPEIMMRFAVEALLDREVAQRNVWLSMERNMQCAIGLCGHCQFGPAFVCKDGPVLRCDAIRPFLSVEGL